MVKTTSKLTFAEYLEYDDGTDYHFFNLVSEKSPISAERIGDDNELDKSKKKGTLIVK